MCVESVCELKKVRKNLEFYLKVLESSVVTKEKYYSDWSKGIVVESAHWFVFFLTQHCNDMISRLENLEAPAINPEPQNPQAM